MLLFPYKSCGLLSFFTEMVIPYFKIKYYFIAWSLAYFEEFLCVMPLAVLIKNLLLLLST